MKTILYGLCIVLVAVCVPAGAEIARVSRVDEHIYRGRQPNRAEYAELARMGIKTVLDLRGGWLHEPHERKEVEAAGMQYISMRLSGIWEPKDEQMARILVVLEDPASWPIFVHCRRGDDRLGEVIASYRMVFEHWTNEQAYQEARRDGISRFEVLMRRYIRHFDPSKVQAMTAAVSARAAGGQ